jgi:hypothetical protein
MKPTAGGSPGGPPRQITSGRCNRSYTGIGETIVALNKTLERMDRQSCLLRNSRLRHLTEEKLSKLINSL